jgi:hypothetical protein
MEQDRNLRYVKSLEKTIQNNYLYLKGTIEEFQDLCRMVTPERNVPAGILSDIREMYKEIRNRLTEVRAIEQLLQGKYRQYYHRDSQRDKEILEFGFITKNCYSKFEYTIMQKEAIKRLKEGSFREPLSKTLQWFRSKENQIALIKNLRTLMDLDYETTQEKVVQERREIAENRTLTLFLFSGDSLSLDHLQSQIQLREHDLIERYSPEEVRGVLTHLKKVDPLEMEKKFQQFMESKGLTKLKGLFLPIHSLQDLEAYRLDLVKTTLQEMNEGKLKTLSI